MATTFSPEFEKATYGKVAWHLIPFLFLCYIVAFLDRVNVGFAKLQMARRPEVSATPSTASVPAYSSSATSFSKCRAM